MSRDQANALALQALRQRNEALRHELKALFVAELEKKADAGKELTFGSEEYSDLLITSLPVLERLMESLGNTVFLEVQREAIDAITSKRHH